MKHRLKNALEMANKTLDAQPAQEPVAWIEHHKAGDNLVWEKPNKGTPLYTTPPEAQPAPVQEPVATDWERIARVQNAKLMAVCDEAGGFEKLCEVMDKYEATTPPQRPWVGLADEDLRKLADKHLFYQPEGYEVSGMFAFARAIEAKLKEKNT